METTVAGYVLEDRLGAGGMGEVWRARRRTDGAPVALKLLKHAEDALQAQRLLREGQILGRLRHPNLVRVHGVGVWNASAFIAMELLEGEPLSALLHAARDSDAPLPEDQIEGVASGVARGVCALHAKRVLHRDIKPSNVMVVGGMVPVLLDLGIALDSNAERLTQEGMFVGTPAYMSPEQVLGEQLDDRSDVYQFGMLLHEMLTLERPYRELDMASAARRRITHGVPPVLSVRADAPARLARLADACLARREERPASMMDVLTLLEHADRSLASSPACASPGDAQRIGPYRLGE